MSLWLLLEILLVTALLTLSGLLLLAWRYERQQLQSLTVRLMTEGRMEAMTAQTLTAMRDAARQHFRNQKPWEQQ